METAKGITAKEVYPLVLQLAMHAEEVSWNRFYNFLVFNTILIVSWAAVLPSSGGHIGRIIFLVLICVLGGASGIWWRALRYRGKANGKAFLDMAAAMEADNELWSVGLGAYKQATKAVELRDSGDYKWAGSFWILTSGPLLYTAS